MPQYIAFLRGINVGGHRVKMDRLRDLFVGCGFDDVSTFIASGNVMFKTAIRSAKTLRQKIEWHLALQLGYEVPTFIRTPAELETIATFQPPESPKGHASTASLYVIFLQTPATDGLQSRLAEFVSEMDDFSFSGSEIYWQIQGKLTESPLFTSGLEKAMGDVPNTTRNMTTLRKLAVKT